MDSLARNRVLALLGIVETRAYYGALPGQRTPRGFEGGGQFKNPAQALIALVKEWLKCDRRGDPLATQSHAFLQTMARELGINPPTGIGLAPLKSLIIQRIASQSDPDTVSIADHARYWHSDLSAMDDLLQAVVSGSSPVGVIQRGSSGHSKAALVNFGDGSDGVVTVYFGGPGRDPEDLADADQLASALGRAIGIPVPRVLRVDDHKTVSDPTAGAGSADAGLRLAVLDLLLGIDSRDPATVVSDVPVQSEQAFAAVPTPETELTERLARLAAVVAAAGPRGLSRADITARLGNMSASVRDELLAELLEDDNYAIVPSSTGNLLAGARFVYIASPPAGSGSQFVRDGAWLPNPLTAADITWLRTRLDAVRQQFVHLGRAHWWQHAAGRLAALARNATGTRNLFAPA